MDEQHYNNLLNFITTNNYPTTFNLQQQNQLQKQARYFIVKHNLLYKKDQTTTNNFLRVIRTWELNPILYMFHNDPTAAHASKDKMKEKIRKRFYWPQYFEDIKTYVESCDTCQRRKRSVRGEPLHPIPIGQPFHRIGIDYVGPLNVTHGRNKYIIVAMDYLTKWPEAKPVKEATAKETVQFIYEDIICRHGCPGEILTDRGTHFNNQLLHELLQKFQIPHRMSSPYHPQTNGLVERFNRTLIESLARTAVNHLADWDKYIAPVLFAYRTNEHSVTKVSPFVLVYGRQAKLPTDSTQIEEETSLVTYLETQINNLPILRNKVQKRLQIEQQKQKDRHDDRLRKIILFQVGDKVLYYDAPLDNQRSHKLQPKWKGPFTIHNVIGNGAYKLQTIDGRILRSSVNGRFLQIYKEPPPHLRQ
jgi:hypothetical protein